MAHWNEIDNISEKLLKKILLGENKADSIPSQEDHGRLTDKYKNWNALADQSKKVLKYDANKAFQKLQFQKYRRRKIITGWSIAASIVLLLSISIFFIQEAPEVTPVSKIEPGYKKATLTLSDGTNWDIREAVQVIQTKNSELKIDSSGLSVHSNTIAPPQEETQYHTLNVPRGGEYNLTLSDGTQVWLNSESELRFPSQFDTNNRTVYCKGEVYFNVTRNPESPFIVKLDKGEVTVLGTEFCTSDYKSSVVEVTLVTGKVQFKAENGDSVSLTPSQHLVYNTTNDSISVTTVDTRVYTAWKDNLFCFEDETLENIMHTLSRWYNVDIYFESEDLKRRHFSGTIEKYSNIKSFLEVFETGTGIKFDIYGHKISIRQLNK